MSLVLRVLVNIIELKKDAWTSIVSMLFIVIRPGTLWEEKGFFSRSLITTHKFNNHSSIRLFLTVWHCKLTRHQCTCCHFITIAYSSCLFTFMTRLLFSLRCPFNAHSLVLVWQFKLLAIVGGGGLGKWGLSCTTFYVDLNAMVFNDLVCIFKVGQIIGVKDYCGLLGARIVLKGKALGIYCSFVFVITIWQLIIYLIKSILFLYRKLGGGWIEDIESRPWRRSR